MEARMGLHDIRQGFSPTGDAMRQGCYPAGFPLAERMEARLGFHGIRQGFSPTASILSYEWERVCSERDLGSDPVLQIVAPFFLLRVARRGQPNIDEEAVGFFLYIEARLGFHGIRQGFSPTVYVMSFFNNELVLPRLPRTAG